MRVPTKLALGVIATALIAGSATIASATTNGDSSQPHTNFAQGVHITSQTDGGFDESLMPGYQSWLGQSVPLVETFGARYNESTLECPSYAMDPETAAGKTVVISWDFFDTSNTTNETWAAAAHGNDPTGTSGVTYDQRYKAFGQCLVNHGQKNAIVRVAQEFNNGSGGMPAIPSNNPTTIANFKAAFATFVTDMRSISGSNFTFDYNPSIDPGNPTDLTYAYPGDAYVDVIGLDSYDGTVPWGQNWTTPQDEWNHRLNGYNGGKGIAFYNNFAKAHGKPISFPEWGFGWYYGNNGATQAPSDDPYFVQQMYNFMSSNNVMYESFWEDHDRGIYTAVSRPAPNSSATYRATFGSESSALWPNDGSAPAPTTSSTSATPPTSTPPPTTPVTSSTPASSTPAPSTTTAASSSAPPTSTQDTGDVTVSTTVGSGVGLTAKYSPPASIGANDLDLVMLTTGADQRLTSIPAGWTLLPNYPVKSQTWGSQSWLFSAIPGTPVGRTSTWVKDGGDAWVINAAVVVNGRDTSMTTSTAYAAWTPRLTPRAASATRLQIALVTTLHNGAGGAQVQAPSSMTRGASTSSYNRWAGHAFGAVAFTRYGTDQGAPTFSFPDPGANPIVSLISLDW